MDPEAEGSSPGVWTRSVEVPGACLATRVQHLLTPARVIGPGRGHGALLLNGAPVPRVVEVGGHDVVGFAITGRLLDREWRRLGQTELELHPETSASSGICLTWIDRHRPRSGRVGVIDVAVADVFADLASRLEDARRPGRLVIAATPVSGLAHAR